MTAVHAPPAPPGPPVVYRPSGEAGSRLHGRNLVIALVVVLAVVVAVATIVVLVGRTHDKLVCPIDGLCVPPTADALSIGTPWTSSELHYSFEYPADFDQIVAGTDTPRGVHLAMPDYRFDPDIWISGSPIIEQSLEDAFNDRINALKADIPDLEKDTDSDDRIPAPGLGFQHGIGGSYTGTTATPQGFSAPAQVAVVGVAAGGVNVVMSFKLSGSGLAHSLIQSIWGVGGDLIVNTFRWK